MKTTFTKEEIIKLLIEYYKRLEGRDVAVEITSKKECTGLYETETCVTTFTVIERFNIAGINKKVETVLSEEEVNTNMKALFSLYDFDLNSLVIEDGLDTEYEGYGTYEHRVLKSYFKGVTVDIKKSKNTSKAMYYR